MADPFYEPLPGLGQVPWDLNGAIQEVRERISSTDDVLASGRLSPAGIGALITELALEITPADLTNLFVSDFSNEVNAKSQFGAAGDGSDCTEQLKSAISYALTSGKSLHIPAGDYLSTETLEVPDSLIIRGDGIGATRVRGANSLNAPVFAVRKDNVGSKRFLTTDAASGDTALQVSTTSGLSAGDYMILGDNTIPDSDYARTSGEMVRVKGISGTTLNLFNPVRGTYVGAGNFIAYTTAQNAYAKKIDMVPGGRISDLSISGNPANFGNSGGILLDGVSKYAVDNVEIFDFGGSGLNIQNSLNVFATNVYAHDLTDNIDNGQYGYGVNVGGASQGIFVGNLRAERVRHAFTTNGGDPGGVPFDILVHSAIAINTSNASFDTHGAGVNITFANCMSLGSRYGYSIRARNVTISNCIAVNSQSDGIIFWGSRDAKVIGSVVRNPKRYGVNILKGEDLSIHSLEVDGSASHGIRIAAELGAVRGVLIQDSTIKSAGRISSSEAIYVVGAIAELSVLSNFVDGKNGQVRSLLDAQSAPNAVVAGNRAINIGFAINQLLRVATSARIFDNVSLDASTWDGGIYVPTASNARFTDITSLLNQSKREGMMVFNGQIHKPLWAYGPAAGDPWVDASGTTVFTPA